MELTLKSGEQPELNKVRGLTLLVFDKLKAYRKVGGVTAKSFIR